MLQGDLRSESSHVEARGLVSLLCLGGNWAHSGDFASSGFWSTILEYFFIGPVP